MSVVYSAIIILLFNNADFYKRLVKRYSFSITKLFIDFSILITLTLIVGSIIQHFIYTFILKPLNLTILLLLVSLVISVVICYLLDFLLKKLHRENLIIFDKHKLSVLVFIGFILNMKMSNSIFDTLLLTLLNLVSYFVVGIIILEISKIISPKIKIKDITFSVLIISSILLMITYVI